MDKKISSFARTADFYVLNCRKAEKSFRLELVVFIGVGQVAIVLVYRILDALQPQPVELGIFFIGNEPAIRRKGVSIGGVYHLDHNKALVLADGHLNEPALGVGDLPAGVQSVLYLVSQNCAQINGGNL